MRARGDGRGSAVSRRLSELGSPQNQDHRARQAGRKRGPAAGTTGLELRDVHDGGGGGQQPLGARLAQQPGGRGGEPARPDWRRRSGGGGFVGGGGSARRA